jgi:hypothetical protein
MQEILAKIVQNALFLNIFRHAPQAGPSEIKRDNSENSKKGLTTYDLFVLSGLIVQAH